MFDTKYQRQERQHQDELRKLRLEAEDAARQAKFEAETELQNEKVAHSNEQIRLREEATKLREEQVNTQMLLAKKSTDFITQEMESLHTFVQKCLEEQRYLLGKVAEMVADHIKSTSKKE